MKVSTPIESVRSPNDVGSSASAPATILSEPSELLRGGAEVTSQRSTASLDEAAALTGKLAHDFGNFLTGILGFTELAIGQVEVDSTPHRYLREVWNSAKQGAQWIHQLQMFGRRSATNHVPTSVRDAVAEQQEFVRTLGRAETTFQTAVPDDLPKIGIEVDALRQVLNQVVLNALESVSAGPLSIDVSARAVDIDEAAASRWLGLPRVGPAVEVTVKDTGAGIKPDIRGKLFRELFVSSKPRRRGLGLAVAYGMLRAYGGGIRIDDNTPRGTVVRVVVPVAKATPPATAATIPTPSATAGMRIAIVDDDASIVRTLSAILQNAGFRIDAFTDPVVAQEKLTRGAGCDLVISDVMMPGLTGFELASRLLDREPKLNFLFISSQASGTIPVPRLRPFELLAKPFDSEALLLAVRRALTRVGKV